MEQRPFGGTGGTVGAIGLGCMGMSWGYDESKRNDDVSVDVIHAALDLGVSLIDTANVYGDGHNERLVGRALRGQRDRAFLATKVGLVVDDLPARAMHRDGDPAHIKAAVDESLRRLAVDTIDLCYLHRMDPDVPLTDTWGAMADLVSAGKVRWLGLSEVTVAEAVLAHSRFPVSAVQSELSVWTRDANSGDTDLVSWCGANNAAFVPFAPLGRGYLTGRVGAADLEPTDFRSGNPRFTAEAMAANQRIVDVVTEVARRHDATPAQVAIAWTLAAGKHVVPIPGTKRTDYLADNVGAADLRLTSADLAELDSVPAATGTRY
jgi:aryl-alcohol dehydrogenase-like predicted oxidoreductase